MAGILEAQMAYWKPGEPNSAAMPGRLPGVYEREMRTSTRFVDSAIVRDM
jgi:hypothetical protein